MWLRMCVFAFVRNGWKYNHRKSITISRPSMDIRSKGQRSRSQGHRVQKGGGVATRVMQSIERPACSHPRWLGRTFESVCLSVCLFVRSITITNSETNDPKVFKLGVGNDLRIFYMRHGLGLKGQRSTTAIRCGFELYKCLLVIICCSHHWRLCTHWVHYTPSWVITGDDDDDDDVC